MTEITVSLAPPNSIIFVADPTHPYEVPDDNGSALVTATSSCISVGTRSAGDGETIIKLGRHPSPSGDPLVFDGLLDTPGRLVAVIDSGADQILTMQVTERRSHVRIWANDPTEPNVIQIEVAPTNFSN